MTPNWNKNISENESTFFTIFNATSESIIIADEAGEIIIANPKADKMFGYDNGELLGQKIEVLIPKSKRSQHKVHRNAYYNDPVPRQMGKGRHLMGINKNNEEFPVEISLTPTKIDGTLVAIAFVIDISERIKMENALRLSEEQLIKYAAQLEKRVEERTEKLEEIVGKLEVEIKERKKAEKETRLALEKEKELNELKSRFVSMASHEFRTPLTTVLSSVSLVAKYDKPEHYEKREKHIQRIKAKVAELTDILNDFLSLDKLEQGKIDYQPEDIDIIDLMNKECEDLRLIAKKGQLLTFNSNAASFIIHIDPKVIKHVMNNLCSNAIKYSPEESEIKIDVEILEKVIKIEIRDQGIGIPKEDQKHLFERFFRANNSTHIQGTGLGLNLVKKYLDLADGSIQFKSKKGKGSTFIVTLNK